MFVGSQTPKSFYRFCLKFFPCNLISNTQNKTERKKVPSFNVILSVHTINRPTFSSVIFLTKRHIEILKRIRRLGHPIKVVALMAMARQTTRIDQVKKVLNDQDQLKNGLTQTLLGLNF